MSQSDRRADAPDEEEDVRMWASLPNRRAERKRDCVPAEERGITPCDSTCTATTAGTTDVGCLMRCLACRTPGLHTMTCACELTLSLPGTTIVVSTPRSPPVPVKARIRPERITHQLPGYKLTEELVRDIRSRHAQGEAIRALGREYDVTPRTIRSIISRQTWKDVV